MKPKPQIPIETFPNGTNVLLRALNYRNMGGTINRGCMVIHTTDKAVLLKVDRDWEDDITMDIMFWMPKIAMYMLQGEQKVYYLKNWAKITNILKNNQNQ